MSEPTPDDVLAAYAIALIDELRRHDGLLSWELLAKRALQAYGDARAAAERAWAAGVARGLKSFSGGGAAFHDLMSNHHGEAIAAAIEKGSQP